MLHHAAKSQPSNTFFFTVRLLDRNSNLLVQEVERLRLATRKTRKSLPFEIDEIVVLPAVIHTIWTLPDGDTDFGKRWRMLKSHFSRGLPARQSPDVHGSKSQGKGIWQRLFWEYHLRDADDIAAHRHMILAAPVQAGLVARPEHWPHSSIHRAIRLGEFDPSLRSGVIGSVQSSNQLLQAG